MSTVIIGFGCKARMGKDEAVAHLIETYKDQYDIRRYAFGDAVKADFYDLLLAPLSDYWGRAPLLGASGSYLGLPHPRQDLSAAAKCAWVDQHKLELGNHLQIFGSEYARGLDPFVWVRRLSLRLNEEKPQIALLSDVRFLNELYYVQAYRGFSVKVTRTGYRLDDGRSPLHESETALDNVKFDYDINVLDGAVDELKRDAVTVFEMILDELAPKAIDEPVLCGESE